MSRASNLFSNAFAQQQGPVAGELSYDIFEGDVNIELGNGYTVDPNTGEFGADITPGVSYDIT